MRFIIFYNDHPKVKDYSIRVWHRFQTHPNFKGELTHPLFIKHYHINPNNVSSLGDVLFNPKTKQWELDSKKTFVNIKENRFDVDKKMIIDFMKNNYHNDTEMINISLKEQSLIANAQRILKLRYPQTTVSIEK